MTVEELLVYGKQYVHSDFAKMLLAELININILELYNNLDKVIEDDLVEQYKQQVQAVSNNKPIQYVIGNVNFLGNKFKITEDVLIPRFETEELVDYTIKYAKELFTEPVDIIDLGCGSGVIGLSLQKNLSTKSVDLIDISEAAIEVAKENANNLGLNPTFIHSDMWKNVPQKQYDIIISNPPYIKDNEEIEDIVKDNEPSLALYAGEDGLDCYKKIFESINNYTKDKCLIALEIGYTQAEDIKNIINTYMKDITIELKQDLSGKDRMIFIFKNLNK